MLKTWNSKSKQTWWRVVVCSLAWSRPAERKRRLRLNLLMPLLGYRFAESNYQLIIRWSRIYLLVSVTQRDFFKNAENRLTGCSENNAENKTTNQTETHQIRVPNIVQQIWMIHRRCAERRSHWHRLDRFHNFSSNQMFKKIYTRIQQSRAEEVPYVQNSDLVIQELKKFQPADSESKVLQKHTGAIFSSLKTEGAPKGASLLFWRGQHSRLAATLKLLCASEHG